LRRLDQAAEAKWADHEAWHAAKASTRSPRVTRLSGSPTQDRLAALDRVVLGRRWGNRWLVLASVVGVALAVVGVIGYFGGGGAGTTQIPFGAGVCVSGVALAEAWSRRQAARGKQAFGWLRRLDRRVLGRKVRDDILTRRGKRARNVAKIAAARRMLEVVYFVLRDGEARCLKH